MRRPVTIIFFLFFGLIRTAALQAQYAWTGPIFVSSGNCVDFVIDERTGYLHIATGVSSSGLIYTVMDSLGQKVHEQVVVAGAPEGNLHWGPTIVQDSQGVIHIVYKSRMSKPNSADPTEPYYDVAYIHQTATGWSSPVILAREVERGYVVRMAIDSEDRIHLANSSVNASLRLLYDGPYGYITYYRIVNGAVDKEKVITPTDNYVYRVDSRFEMAVTPDDKLHFIYGNPDYHSDAPQINYTRSVDHGSTWTYIEDLNASQADRSGSPDIFVDGTGSIHIVYGTMTDAALGGEPSLRYVRYQGNFKAANNYLVTGTSDIQQGWACGSVASTSGGEYLAVAFLSHRGYGALYTTLSSDEGLNWTDPQLMANSTADFNDDGRNTPLIRGYRNHLYLIYPVGSRTYLYYLRDLGDEPPVAAAGGPYSGQEGGSITFNMSNSSDSGLNAGIVDYAWDWTGDGVYDTLTTASTLRMTFTDNFSGRAVLRVRDRAGHADTDTVAVSVSNVPPVIGISGPRRVGEMETLRLEAVISDVGTDDTHTLSWDLGPGLTGDAVQVEAQYKDDGNWLVQLTVQDDDGGVAVDTAHITIYNRPPVADAGGPYRTAPMETLTLTGSGSDPSPEDEVSGRWDLDGDGVFEFEGFVATLSFSAVGTYGIVFEARDDDGGFDLDTAEVVVSNGAPVIGEIPDQTIDEGEAFTPIELDQFVTDQEQSQDRLTWTVSGQEALLADLSTDRVLTVAIPDTEWAGQETLRLIVADPIGLMDTCWVNFTVLSINDPPRWIGLPSTEFNEDDSLSIPLAALAAMTLDPDHNFDELAWSLEGNTHIHGGFDDLGTQWLFWADADWYGEETVQWVVGDPEGAEARLTLDFTVHSMADPPAPFRLIRPLSVDTTAWPDSIRFNWNAAVDPDSNDAVFYVLHISSQGSGSSWTYNSPSLSDTTLLFRPSGAIEPGLYFWWVEARDLTNHSRESENNGTIFIRALSGVEDTETTLRPDTFRLLQNHPNPFNPETQITFHTPKVARVHVAVYNMLGQMIRVLANEERGPGVHTLIWNGRDEMGNLVPSGVYLCRMTAEGQAFMCKMMLMQ